MLSTQPPLPADSYGARPRPRLVAVVLVGVALLAASCTGDAGGSSSGPDPDAPLAVVAVSGPAEYVTGGDAVVAVLSPAGESLDGVTVTIDGIDVTDAFSPDDATYRAPNAPVRLIGHLSGLSEGVSIVTARRGDDDATLTLTNHPISGPLFSGPQQSPFVCTTEEAGLGAPGAECGAPTQVSWRYLDQAGAVHDLADPLAVPADVATTTTTLGATVPFVVRVERSVLDRSIVETAILDPSPGTGPGDGGPDGSPAWDPSGWNGRLVMRFGGGCGVTYSQGDVSPTALQKDLLGAGYAVTSGSLTAFGTACNATLSAEVALVTKEHFVETYGVPRHTIGSGGSGGAIQQLQIAQNYPGILDALSPTALFPDAASIAPGVADCGLLERWFGRNGGPAGVIADGQPSGAGLTDAQQTAITGFASTLTCAFWTRTYLTTLDASEGCDASLATEVYDRAVRPEGVRCTWQDGNVNMLGTDPVTGYAARPLDNVGVQYGLQALRDGVISVDEFLDLNEHIGGFDLDGTWQPDRTRASDDVLDRAYAAGMVTAGTATAEAGVLGTDAAGGLSDVPIIVVDTYTDPYGDIHDRQRAFALRQRLRTPDGAENPLLAIWTVPLGQDLQAIERQFEGGAEDSGQPVVRLLDRWLSAAEEADGATWAERLAATRPTEATDRCVLPDGEVLTGTDVYTEGSPCAEAYPVHGDPRQAAGAPLVGDVLSCDLVDVDPDAYGTELTDDQRARLEAIFPYGVCDWSNEGRGQQAPDGAWQTF